MALKQYQGSCKKMFKPPPGPKMHLKVVPMVGATGASGWMLLPYTTDLDTKEPSASLVSGY